MMLQKGADGYAGEQKVVNAAETMVNALITRNAVHSKLRRERVISDRVVLTPYNSRIARLYQQFRLHHCVSHGCGRVM